MQTLPWMLRDVNSFDGEETYKSYICTVLLRDKKPFIGGIRFGKDTSHLARIRELECVGNAKFFNELDVITTIPAEDVSELHLHGVMAYRTATIVLLPEVKDIRPKYKTVIPVMRGFRALQKR